MAASTGDKITDTYNAANPNVARVTVTRTAGATSLTCDNLAGWPTVSKVHFSTYQINTSNAVVAGTQIDWYGIVSGNTIGSLTRITGATDAGSTIGDVVEMNPTASWAHDLYTALTASHNLDGTMITNLPLITPKVTTGIKDANGNTMNGYTATASAVNYVNDTNSATGGAPIIAAAGSDAAISLNLRGKGLAKSVTIGAGAASIWQYDFVYSGCVWSGDAYASTRNASMTAGVVVINGNPVTVAAVTARSFTASKDTYVDVLDNGDGTGLLVYTETTNNAASAALASNSIRIAIIVTGATTIAAATSVNQGQETMVLPIIASTALSVTDSLGNLICPRDPNRKLLGQRQLAANFVPGTTAETLVTGLNCPVIIPTGRKVRITASHISSGSTGILSHRIYEGVFGSGGVQKQQANETTANGSVPVDAVYTPTSTSITFTSTVASSVGNPTVNSSATASAFLRVELE